MLEDDGDEEVVEAEMEDVVGSGGFGEMCVSIIIPLRSVLCGIARGGDRSTMGLICSTSGRLNGREFPPQK